MADAKIKDSQQNQVRQEMYVYLYHSVRVAIDCDRPPNVHVDTVYSPKDQQACLDHDRASGEGVLVQEYSAVKCKVKRWSESAQKALEGKLPQGANVFLVPATLRPETMYGQSNIFVAHKINYGIFQVSENDFYFITERAARNMAFQNIFPKWGVFPKVASVVGADVIGTLVTVSLLFRRQMYQIEVTNII
jgi:leucyl-tRNA synthetase